MSAQYAHHITVRQLLNDKEGSGVDMVSVSGDGQLLVGQKNNDQFFIYKTNGDYVKSLSTPSDVMPFDAIWTPLGNIVIATDCGVETVSSTGIDYADNDIIDLRFLSVSIDNVTYVADCCGGVYESTDDDDWNIAFEPQEDNKWSFLQAIKVSTDQKRVDTFWTAEINLEKTHRRLCVYTVKNSDDYKFILTHKNVTVPSSLEADVEQKLHKLAFDGQHTIFVILDQTADVYLWSVSGQFDRQLKLLPQVSLDNSLLCLTVDRHNHDVRGRIIWRLSACV